MNGAFAKHVYREPNQTADTVANKGSGGKADIWVNKSNWDAQEDKSIRGYWSASAREEESS